MALDANQNATAATLPKVPTTKAASLALFAPLAKSKSSSRPPSKPDPIKALFPKNIPDWFVIIYTYSVVLILVLLVANSTPDGKLFIHFNALWCLIIYFILEEDQVRNVFILEFSAKVNHTKIQTKNVGNFFICFVWKPNGIELI